MNTASAPATAAFRSVVKDSRPALALTATTSSRPGSKIGMPPAFRVSTLPASLSMQITSWPNSDRQAPETSPTYPVPIMAMRMESPKNGAFFWPEPRSNTRELPKDCLNCPFADNGL